jgi:hypothetical protein
MRLIFSHGSLQGLKRRSGLAMPENTPSSGPDSQNLLKQAELDAYVSIDMAFWDFLDVSARRAGV